MHAVSEPSKNGIEFFPQVVETQTRLPVLCVVHGVELFDF